MIRSRRSKEIQSQLQRRGQRHGHRGAPCLLIACGLAWLTVVPPARSARAEAVEWPLDAAEVRVELHRAVVDVVSDATARPVLRAWFEGDDAGGPEPDLSRSNEDGVLHLLQAADMRQGPDAPVLRVEVLVGAEQTLRLAGSDLRIASREIETSGVTAPRGVHYDLEQSQLEVFGGRDTQIEAEDSSVWLDRSRGSLNLSTSGGTVEVQGHAGEVEIVSSRTDLTMSNCAQRLGLDLTGGSLRLDGGGGELRIEAEEATLWVERWRGSLQLTGSDSTLEARDSAIQGRGKPWELKGSQLQVTLEDLTFGVNATLEGGRLDGRRLSGALHVDARDLAILEVDDLSAEAHIELADGSQATFRAVQALDLTLSDAAVRADEVQSLKVTGSRAELVGSSIDQIVSFDLADSQVDLDLSRLSRDATLRLAESGDIRLDLPSPCLVRLSSSGDAGPAYPVDVVGCELRLPGQPVGQARRREIYGERQVRTVTLELHGDVYAAVEGNP